MTCSLRASAVQNILITRQVMSDIPLSYFIVDFVQKFNRASFSAEYSLAAAKLFFVGP